MTRAIGIDLGTRRIGVAVSDSDGRVAVPLEVVQRSGDRAGDHRRLAALVDETEAEVAVVGVPYSLDGARGSAARRALAEIRLLERALRVPVETYDERLSTVTAERSLKELDLSAPARRRVVDKVAAAVILQGWLDHRRHSTTSRQTDDRSDEEPPT